jgi:hypothetical protein
MGLEQNNEQQYREVVDKYVDPNVNYQMSTRDYVVRPFADRGTGPIVVTLPPVAEAKGRFYSIIARAADTTNTITVRDKDDSECWEGDITLNGFCDRLLLYSDGLAWCMPCKVLTPEYTMAPTTLPPTSLAPTTQGA